MGSTWILILVITTYGSGQAITTANVFRTEQACKAAIAAVNAAAPASNDRRMIFGACVPDR